MRIKEMNFGQENLTHSRINQGRIETGQIQSATQSKNKVVSFRRTAREKQIT
jgi:hypothetical protein